MSEKPAEETFYPLENCEPSSVRTLVYPKRDNHKVRFLFCCPKGEWDATKQRCRVGTKLHKLVREKLGSNPTLCSLIRQAIEEEKSASQEYLDMAEVAEKEGQPKASSSLKEISGDEASHSKTLKELHEGLKCKK